jgi:magnesium and cobalt exporter, CNNM family
MMLEIVIGVVVVCILVEGFFSGSEIAVVNADKYRLAMETDAGSKSARAALHLVKHPGQFFATTLLGTNLAAVTCTVTVTLYIIQRYGGDYAPFAIVVWPLMLIFGEIVPKSLFQHNADKIVLKVAPVLLVFSYIFYPVVWIFSKMTDSVLGGMKRRAFGSEEVSREALEIMLEVGEESASDMRKVERTFVSRIFDLDDKKVENIMTPLVDVIGVPITASIEEVAEVLDEQGFSRIPVYEDQAFNMIGVLTGTDLLFGPSDAQLRNLVRKPYYVPEEMPLDELLMAMKRKSEAMAIAVDEYGAATGIVTAEDLLEEVVGEIRDEHDEEPPLYNRLAKNRYLVNARLEIEHANEKLKLSIPEGEYETIAGFMIHHMEKIPARGESFSFGGFLYRVHRANDRAVLEVEIKREASGSVQT